MDIFAYGTLQLHGLVHSLIGRVPTMDPVVLPDHVRLGRGIYTTFPHLGENVQGMLLRDLTPDEIKRFDRYEGCGHGYYERCDVTVRMADGSTLSAQAYLGGPRAQGQYQDWLALQ